MPQREDRAPVPRMTLQGASCHSLPKGLLPLSLSCLSSVRPQDMKANRETKSDLKKSRGEEQTRPRTGRGAAPPRAGPALSFPAAHVEKHLSFRVSVTVR